MTRLLVLALLAGCGGMAGQLEDTHAALEKAEPYVLTGCDLTAEDTGLNCPELVKAYEETLQLTRTARQCLEVPGHLVRATGRLSRLLPAE